MTRASRPIATVLAMLFLSLSLLARPAAAQTFLRDAETEAMFNAASDPLVEAAGMRPGNVEFVLLDDPSINAFVAGGQRVYVHSGLIMEADHVGQLQAVLAHELGHVEGGHILRAKGGVQDATAVSIVSLILGGLAVAAGNGEAGLGAIALGQQVAMSRFLAFSRTQESSADQAGARYLMDAGVSGQGYIEFFKKLQNQEYRLNIPQEDSYARTHPLTRERIQVLREALEDDQAWDRPPDPELDARFQRVKAKLIGYLDPQRALRDYPHGDTSIAGRTARAYAYHQGGYPDEAAVETSALLEARPDDPFLLELHGQILLENGAAADALGPLRRAVERAPDQPLIATTLGHALVSLEDRELLPEAEQVLRGAVARDRTNGFAWYNLGVIYDRNGDDARAALASAERFQILGQHKLALASARRAMGGIEQQGPDWIRAQDIALTSEHELKRAGIETDR
ncbi:M48 family metalloprotease [Sphingomicrobium sp. XHP0239]|uniref:M48 family metalloprotease n=1 Tax=Sphingomicrobium maritimum TaxID=3133972 RepID=UPI0031CC4E0D